MIAYIKGTVAQLTDQSVVLDNRGMGYMVQASPATLSHLPRKGEMTQLHTYMQVKEDGISLFGFLSTEELHTFHLLISVSGVGPKAAMSILATLTPVQVMTAIVSEDAAAFSKAPGVGKKIAQRISLELRDKIKTQDWAGERESGLGAASGGIAMASSEKQDAIEALLALGYGRSEAMRAVLECAEENMPAPQIIRLALKKLV